MGAYQRRETLRFYGISEDSEGEEGTQQVLKSFMQSEFGIENACSRLNSKRYTELVFTTYNDETPANHCAFFSLSGSRKSYE